MAGQLKRQVGRAGMREVGRARYAALPAHTDAPDTQARLTHRSPADRCQTPGTQSKNRDPEADFELRFLTKKVPRIGGGSERISIWNKLKIHRYR